MPDEVSRFAVLVAREGLQGMRHPEDRECQSSWYGLGFRV